MTAIVSSRHIEALQDAIRGLMASDQDKSLDILKSILREDPNVPEALHLLGICSLTLGDLGRSIELVERAHELDPDCRDYVDALASLKAKAGDLNASLYFGKLATTLDPHPELDHLTPLNLQNYAEALNAAHRPTYMLDAILSYSRRNFEHAQEMCARELRINPTSLEALRLSGKCLIELGEHPRAEIALHAAEQLESGDAETLADLGRCLTMQGKHEDAIACFDYAAETNPDDVYVVAEKLRCLSFMPDGAWSKRQDTNSQFLARVSDMGLGPFEQFDDYPDGKIRIGLLSDGFYDCDAGLLIGTFLQNYNKRRFEVFCLQQSVRSDKMTEVFKTQCDSWRSVYNLDDWVLGSIIAGDGIQAVLDLSGFGSATRLATLSAKPAPVNVAWFNHMDGCAEGIIDTVLSDAQCADVDRRNAPVGQDVSELETGLFAYSEFSLFGEVTPLPAQEHDTVTFGAYADLARITPQIALNWAKVLKAVPRSLLALNVLPNLPGDVRSALSARFAHFGVSNRVVFVDNANHETAISPIQLEQEFLNGIDILLDPARNSSPSQIARALWMGVPVLTQKADRRTGLIAASILQSAEQPAWIAQDADALVECAVNLTTDLSALAETRATLRDHIKDTPLFDGRELVREIETAIEMALEDKGVI